MDSTGQRPHRIRLTTLNEIDREVAWLYAIVARVIDRVPLTRPTEARCVRHLLAKSVRFAELSEFSDPLSFEPHLAMDIATVLTRALQRLEEQVSQLSEEPEHRPLVTVIEHLATVASALRDQLTGSTFRRDNESSNGVIARRICQFH